MSVSNEELLESLAGMLERYQGDSVLLLRGGPAEVELMEWVNHAKAMIDLLLAHSAMLTRVIIDERS